MDNVNYAQLASSPIAGTSGLPSSVNFVVSTNQVLVYSEDSHIDIYDLSLNHVQTIEPPTAAGTVSRYAQYVQGTSLVAYLTNNSAKIM